MQLPLSHPYYVSNPNKFMFTDEAWVESFLMTASVGLPGINRYRFTSSLEVKNNEQACLESPAPLTDAK